MIFALFLMLCYAQEPTGPEEPQEPEDLSYCGNGRYYNIVEQTCKEVHSCEENMIDEFYGCLKCESDATTPKYAYAGECVTCMCGSHEYNVDHCVDGIGCEECPEETIMDSKTHYNGMIENKCLSLADLIPDENADPVLLTDREIYAKNTLDYCSKWGPFGCESCRGNNYVNNSLCYPHTHCAVYEDVMENGVAVGKCSACKTPLNSDESIYYYFLNGVCTACDPNCVDCDMQTGKCNKCFNKFYPLEGKKCYACDTNCDIESCSQDLTQTEGKRCTKCNDGYYLVNGEYCMECPAECAQCETDKGCVSCKDYTTHFLIPFDFMDSKFHYNYSNHHIGLCVAHQEDVCKGENKTANGCKSCEAPYVLDNVTYRNSKGELEWRGFCSGVSETMILALIAFLFVLAF